MIRRHLFGSSNFFYFNFIGTPRFVPIIRERFGSLLQDRPANEGSVS